MVTGSPIFSLQFQFGNRKNQSSAQRRHAAVGSKPQRSITAAFAPKRISTSPKLSWVLKINRGLSRSCPRVHFVHNFLVHSCIQRLLSHNRKWSHRAVFYVPGGCRYRNIKLHCYRLALFGWHLLRDIVILPNLEYGVRALRADDDTPKDRITKIVRRMSESARNIKTTFFTRRTRSSPVV